MIERSEWDDRWTNEWISARQNGATTGAAVEIASRITEAELGPRPEVQP